MPIYHQGIEFTDIGSFSTKNAFGKKKAREAKKNHYYDKVWDAWGFKLRPSASKNGLRGGVFDLGIIPINELSCMRAGLRMENDAEALKMISEEMRNGSEELQKTVNVVMKTSEQLAPLLNNMITETRDMRMTVTTELQKSLKLMKDVRKFFLEPDYKEEMKRLNEFVLLGERMKALISDGTMDAVCDAAIKLAVGDD